MINKSQFVTDEWLEDKAGGKLNLISISKAFKYANQNRCILNDVSLTVNKGEFVTLLGPSGCGKTTLFRLIGGIESPDGGQIMMDGVDFTGKKGLISYMPQQAVLFPWLTVVQNISFSLRWQGLTKSARLQLTRQWLERINLANVADQYPYTLSGGMQQRVSFLRALLLRRKIMCLDEPFASLDALSRTQMQEWLLQLWEQERRSVLFVTHSIEEALLLSDRVYVLSSSPTHVLQNIKVPFTRPRHAELCFDPEFILLKRKILHLLAN